MSTLRYRVLAAAAACGAVVVGACATAEAPPPGTPAGMSLDMASVTGDVTLQDTWETPYGLRITFTRSGPELDFLLQHGEQRQPVTVSNGPGEPQETLGFRWEVVGLRPDQVRVRVFEPAP